MPIDDHPCSEHLAPTPTPPRVIVALVTEQGVNMGDHGQDMTRAVVVDPDETVAAFVERTLTKRDYTRPVWDAPASLVSVPDPGRYLTVRLAVAE